MRTRPATRLREKAVETPGVLILNHPPRTVPEGERLGGVRRGERPMQASVRQRRSEYRSLDAVCQQGEPRAAGGVTAPTRHVIRGRRKPLLRQ